MKYALLLALVMAGCSTKEEAPPAIVTEPAPTEQEIKVLKPDPLEEFKKIVAEVEQRATKPEKWIKRFADTRELRERGSAGLWRREETHYSNVTYDVQKTDSLVSPYKGTIQVTCQHLYYMTDGKHDHFASEAGAMASTTIRRQPPTVKKVNYLWQNDQWIIQKSNWGIYYPFREKSAHEAIPRDEAHGEVLKAY